MSQPAAGWYPDPSGDSTKIRYWDGVQWTNDVRENTTTPGTVQPGSGSSQTEASSPTSGYTSAPAYTATSTTSTNTYGSPTQPTTASTPGYQTPGAYQAPGQMAAYGQPTATAPAKDNAPLAKAGFFCAVGGCALNILSFFMSTVASFFAAIFLISYILAIPAIILSAIGLKSSKRGLAITGLVVGILGVVSFILFMLLVFVVLRDYSYLY
ncbi:MAG: DUF2510 domain-containing protein [Coriobacteriia bacterium]|nr:DUF2510 domain-containing protein [Coriobacteriia bacterium]MCL2136666.1 DUF2510 domain-containing protein [Coriobacteriia bacterium]